MTIFEHSATYQGYTVKGLAFSRSIGLTPDTGSLVIDLEEAKKIDVEAFDVHWRSQAGQTKPVVAGISIDTFFDIIDTVADDVFNQEIPQRFGGGFKEAGDLVLKTTANGELQPETRYADIYVDISGIAEVTQDLDDVLEHNRGDVRVPITDIRKFWRTYGNLFQRINTRLRTGKFDPMSVEDDGNAFSMRKVLAYLFGLLPGAPGIHSKSVTSTASFDPPEDIPGDGTPIIEILEKILSRNGLVVGLLPNNQVLIQRFPATGIDPTSLPLKTPSGSTGVGPITYETKTSAIGEKPTVVEVIGKKRLRRMTLNYIPVFPDESGVWRRLEDVEKVFPGIPFSDVAEWASAGNEKAFRNVGPVGNRSSVRRAKILLDHAFKTWAPAAFFAEGNLTAIPSIAPGGAPIPSFVRGYTDKDIERLPFMPMQEFPVYQSQLDELVDVVPVDKQVTDAEEVILVKPAVRASRIGWGFFQDFEKIQNIFDGMKDARRRRTTDQRDQLAQAERLLDVYSKSLISEQQRLADLIGPFTRFLQRVGQETVNFFTFQQVPLRSVIDDAIENEEEDQKRLKDKIAAFKEDVTRLKTTKDAALGLERALQLEFDALKRAYKDAGGVSMLFNLPPMLMSSGYSLNRDTGIIQFANPMMVSDLPFYMDADHAKRADKDASEVYVTFGYEIDNNAHLDLTTVQIGLVDGSPEVVSIESPSVFAPFVIRQPSMQLYEEDQGSAMNLEAVKEKAIRAAKGILGGVTSSEGFNQQLDGFLPVVLASGIVGVQHIWGGDDAYTWVAHNSITGALPLGPIILKDRINTGKMDIKEIIETIREAVEP